jgi:hypothetical protein
MQRLRISPFQVRILRVLHERAQKYKSGCSNRCRLVKEALYDRQRGLSTAQRVTLCRSVDRLTANGMIAEEEPGSRCFRLTAKGQAWLEAHAPPEPAEAAEPLQEQQSPALSNPFGLAWWERWIRSAAEDVHDKAASIGQYLDRIRTRELWKDDHPDWSWSDYLTHRQGQLLAGVRSAQAALTELLDVVQKSKEKK